MGKASWKDFCQALKASSPVESEEFSGESVVSMRLEPGTRLQLGWLPDRFRRAGSQAEARYVAGERNGLTLVKEL